MRRARVETMVAMEFAIVKAVHEVEQQEADHQGNDNPRLIVRVSWRAARSGVFKDDGLVVLATSLQRSVTDSSSS
jgi:hypothetical protein